ncbi:hypothetical protein CAPTEDRAFT_184786 [Capitella teleta]|uniref:Uncharacterized protein n=1 Tax=Capitella teleta TaxID=283909 RepID=R7V1R7_CAPTE|nr:hypothetical protein CAPTEDRAFT_184786 [Capitella teleta]|eukprot:ELU09606.1 hypothetical protein CAPTEDRAFT_184786 [Capitella teleta]
MLRCSRKGFSSYVPPRFSFLFRSGASSGVGAGTATAFAKEGAKLALTGRRRENLEKTAEKCRELGVTSDNILLLVGDLTNDKFVEEIVQTTVKHFGQLDVLVNNAGIYAAGSIEDSGMDEYDAMMRINARVCYFLSHLSVPHLKKTKGTIVNVSSLDGLRSFSGEAPYCISKAAVDQLTKCSALDLAPYGIRVNAVNPGVIKTELQQRSGMHEDTYSKFLKWAEGVNPLGCTGKVDDVTPTIVHLASSRSSYVTGACVSIDGGRAASTPR